MKLPLLLRRLHLWLGCLFAPLLVFFALSGLIQTLGWNDGASKKNSAPADAPAIQQLMEKMTAGHTASRSPYEETAGGERHYRPFSLVPSDTRNLPYSAFVALMALGMAFTSGLGVWMAFRFGGSPKLVSLLLVTGILAPFLLYLLRR